MNHEHCTDCPNDLPPGEEQIAAFLREMEEFRMRQKVLRKLHSIAWWNQFKGSQIQ